MTMLTRITYFWTDTDRDLYLLCSTLSMLISFFWNHSYLTVNHLWHKWVIISLHELHHIQTNTCKARHKHVECIRFTKISLLSPFLFSPANQKLSRDAGLFTYETKAMSIPLPIAACPLYVELHKSKDQYGNYVFSWAKSDTRNN